MVDNYKQLAGKTLTVSLLHSSTAECRINIRANGSNNTRAQSPLSTDGLVYTTYTLPDELTKLEVYIATSSSAGCVMTPIAAKLELGSQQTLAHQDEDGNWVLNEIPNYNEQLLRCCMSTADSADEYANNKKTAEQIGARPNTWMPTAEEIGAAEAVTHNVKTYYNLAQIGMAAGSETMAGIAEALPNNSILSTPIGSTSLATNEYPAQTNGMLFVKKGGANRVFFLFESINAKPKRTFVGEFYTAWNGWTELATTDYAVNKAGDTMTGALKIHSSGFKGQLDVSRNGTSGASVVKFSNNNGVLGALGVSNINTPVFYSGDSTDANVILHSGNYSDYTLPSAGGTVTGRIYANGNISLTNTNPWILLTDSDTGTGHYIQTASNTLALGTVYGKSVLISNTGLMTLQSETTIADNTPARLNFSVKQTDNNISSTSYIAVYDDLDTKANGNNMVVATMSGLYLAAGEGAAAYLANNPSTGENVHVCADSTIYFHTNCNTVANATSTCYINTSGVLYGAAWNDYAEYRKQFEEVEPGYCVASADDGRVYKTTKKFQACDGIVSDTFGFAIGETEDCKTPLAVAGRVLAYCEGDRYDYHSGDTVCAGPNGKVCKMTREEIKEYPDRIIGIVSEIPEYSVWGSGNVPVNGRIWIKVK